MRLTRRTLLGAAVLAAGCTSRGRPSEALVQTRTQPALFIGHGAPTLAIDPAKGAPLRALGATLSPTAVLVVSAHWEDAPVTIGATEPRPLIHDYMGFPAALSRVQYPSPGAPALAARVRALLGSERTRDEPTRGLDHGAWTPLVHLWPDARIPVLQVSLPSTLGAAALFGVGRALAPLRDEGVVIIGSGNLTHNLRGMRPDGSPPEAFAAEFDAWAEQALRTRDVDALLEYRRRAPAFRENHPSEEHWLPLLVALGAGSTTAGVVSFPVTGFEYGNLSRRTVAFG